jgi:hypothetical protein
VKSEPAQAEETWGSLYECAAAACRGDCGVADVADRDRLLYAVHCQRVAGHDASPPWVYFSVFCGSAFLMMRLARRLQFQLLMSIASLALALFVEVGESVLSHNPGPYALAGGEEANRESGNIREIMYMHMGCIRPAIRNIGA